jgi:glyoxylase-like metal-dependent hydrolase (beta-lactamase superfamily II)
MFIKSFESGTFLTIGYLVADEVTREAIVIDAPQGSARAIVQTAKDNGFRINALINTHGHWDHTADNHHLQQALMPQKLPILIHREDEHWLNGRSIKLLQIPFEFIPSTAEGHLEDGQVLGVGDLRFIVLFTPGHTTGGICLYEPIEKILFTGDTLFAGSIGRTDLPGGSEQLLIKCIASKLLVLGDDVVVYPGHGPSTTIGEERVSNPFLERGQE